ncbi:MAG: hypothetical protein ABSC56_13730 [Solirubrobacteraceae bacterium]|jgi:hypothetical protein
MATTIGSELERWRLERRALRLEVVVALLGERVSRCAETESPPPTLERALRDFARELDGVRRRLENHPNSPSRPPTSPPAGSRQPPFEPRQPSTAGQ